MIWLNCNNNYLVLYCIFSLNGPDFSKHNKFWQQILPTANVFIILNKTSANQQILYHRTVSIF